MQTPIKASSVVWPVLILGIIVGARAVGVQSQTLTITLTGQSMLRSDLRSTAPAAMSTIPALVKGADVVFTNLEATVAQTGEPNERTPRRGALFTSPGALDSLKELGFNLVATSNNHSADLGVPGVLNALKEADRVGLAHAGTGKTLDEAAAPALLKTAHGTVALVGIASGMLPDGAIATTSQPGVNELRLGPGNVPREEDTRRVLQSIRDASKKADIVIVYQHNHVFDKNFGEIFRAGLPDRMRPPAWLKKWVHDEIDAGADLVVMHGAPILHGIELYRGKPIFYDLGNFFFNASLVWWTLGEPMCWDSVVATVEFQGKNLRTIRLRPIVLNYMGEGQPDARTDLHNQFTDTRGLPAPATGEQARYILERVRELSRPFGTIIDVHNDKAEVRIR